MNAHAVSLRRRAFALALLLGSLAGCQLAGVPVAPPDVEPALISFASDEGLARLARAGAKVNFPRLANQYEAQLNGAFCGPTSAAIVLNTVRNRSADLPRDHILGRICRVLSRTVP